MRIAVVSPFLDRSHGTERALLETIQRLANQYGCDIHLFSQDVRDLPLPASPRHLPTLPGRITCHRVPSISGPHIFKFIFWLAANAFLRRWYKLIHSASFDLLLSPGINSLHPDLVIVHALFARLRQLASQQTSTIPIRPRFARDLHRRLYYLLLVFLERRVYSNPRVHLAAVSSRTAALLHETFGRSAVPLILNGVDTAEFSPAARQRLRAAARSRRGVVEGETVLLLIGNDWLNKGVPTVLQAMACHPAASFRFLAIGSDDPAPFRAYAKTLGLEPRCLWERPQPDILDAYAAADIYVSPSREDAFALPPLEAMACGLPVITSLNNGGSQVISNGQNGFVLDDPTDHLALAALLERLHQDSAARRTVGENASRAAQQYSWDRTAACAWELIQEVAARKIPANMSARSH